MEIDDPGNTKPIHVLWAWICTDKNGNDGIMAMGGSPQTMQPLVSSNKELMLRAESMVRDAARQTDKAVFLVSFVRMEAQ